MPRNKKGIISEIGALTALSDNQVAFWIAVCVATHFLAALFSSGFHHYDEHFAILEHAGYKLGLTPIQQLPIGFFIQLRPWFPPGVLVLIAKTCRMVGIENPFTWATLFRVVSGAIGVISTIVFARGALPLLNDKKLRTFCFIFACFNWMFPYLHAHPSAESWGSSFFFWGLGLLLIEKEKSKSVFTGICFIGVLWCLAFQSRFQVGVMIGAATIWFWIKRDLTLKENAGLFLGFAFATLICAFIDRWGYGNWVFPAWNYFRDQVLEHKAAQAGVDPIWDYFRRTLLQGGFPLTLVVVAGALGTWLLRPKSLLTAVTFSFFVVHSLMGHKELRYMFPIVPATPWLLGISLEAVSANFLSFTRKLAPLFLGWSAVYLLALACVPARSEIPMFQYLYNHAKGKQVLYFTESPYLLAGIESFYYRPPGVRLARIYTDDAKRRTAALDSPFLVFYAGFTSPLPESGLAHCSLAYASIPELFRKPPWDWIVHRTLMRGISLYECRNGQ